MPNAYDDPTVAADFDRFLTSEDGRLQQEILWESITPYLTGPGARILDAACGQGWLAGRLKDRFPEVEAFDSSETLIEQAKRNHPKINFQMADLTTTIPYSANSFDTVILNMAAHDLSNLPKAFSNLHQALKPGGTFIMTIANPYYSFPVGVWKRGIVGKIFRAMPRLLVRPYHNFTKQKSRLQNWRGHLSSYFYPLPEYLNQAIKSGFALKAYRDLESPNDSITFNVRYQLHRYPLILLLVFEKSRE